MAEAQTEPGKAYHGQEPRIACRDITGIDCDFVAQRDLQPESAEGPDADQLLTQLSTHVAAEHGMTLGPDQRDGIRAAIGR